MLIYTNDNNTGNGTGHEAFLHALDYSVDHAIALAANRAIAQQFTNTIILAVATTLIVLLTMAAAKRQLRG